MPDTPAALLGIAIIAPTFLIDLAIRVALLFYVPRNRKPTAATAWLLAIFILPIIGTLLFFIFGNTKLSTSRRAKQAYMSKELRKFARMLKANRLVTPIRSGYQNSAMLAESFGDLPPLKHNKVKLLSGYDSIIKDMTHSVDAAQQYVYVEFYIVALDPTTEPFFQAMERALGRGIRVYLLFDHYATRRLKGYRALKQRLDAIGVHWCPILPMSIKRRQYNRPDLRNHRKIVAIDNRVSYLGSLNLIEHTYQRKDALQYVELTVRIEGTAVNECAAVFASDWYAETGAVLRDYRTLSAKQPTLSSVTTQILPGGPSYTYENNLKFFVSLIYSAKKSIVITNPYFVPDESLLGAIISAVKRGVKVSILNSEIMDQWLVGHAQRSYYQHIMEAGVEIYLYNPPVLQHSKYIVVDAAVAVIGSSNLDIRSFELNLECISIFYDTGVAKKLHAHHTADCRNNSRKLSLATWRQRSLLNNLVDSLTRLTSALQ